MEKNKELTPKKSIKNLVPAVCDDESVGLFLDTVQFDQGFRAARLLAESKGLIPKEYEGNPGNCMLALNMAKSLGLTMQAFFNWTYPVNGKLGIEAKAIVTIANQSGMFKRGVEFEEIGTPKDGNEWGFKAFAEDARYGTIIEETFTIGDAKAAGWITNTWWKKLPRLMLKYRAASFLIKLNRPELLGGMDVFEELRDEIGNQYRPMNIDITDEVNKDNPEPEKPEPKKTKVKSGKKMEKENVTVSGATGDGAQYNGDFETNEKDSEELVPGLVELEDWMESDQYAKDYSRLVKEGTLTAALIKEAQTDPSGRKAADIMNLVRNSK